MEVPTDDVIGSIAESLVLTSVWALDGLAGRLEIKHLDFQTGCPGSYRAKVARIMDERREQSDQSELSHEKFRTTVGVGRLVVSYKCYSKVAL